MEWMAIKIVAEISKLGSQIVAEGVQNKHMNLPFFKVFEEKKP